MLEESTDFPGFCPNHPRPYATRLIRCRSITIFQVIWFSANTIGRAVQHLHITSLELTTLAFIPCTLATAFCWREKPAAIENMIVLKCKRSITELRQAAGVHLRETYSRTPLDYISRNEWTLSLLWAHFANVLQRFHIPLFSRRCCETPITRIPNDNWPAPDFTDVIYITVVGWIYGAIFVAGWNFRFPTYAERVLWRISSVSTIGIMICCTALEAWRFSTHTPMVPKNAHLVPETPEVKALSRRSHWYSLHQPLTKAQIIASRARNYLIDEDLTLAMPLRLWFPWTLVALIYALFRVYILIEDFIALRRLPASAFKTVEWSRYFQIIN